MTSASSMHEGEYPKLVLWDNPKGWVGDGGGKGVRDGVHMYTCGWFMWMYGKNHHNMLKKKKKRKLSAEELMVLNCGVGEDSWDFLGLQGDQTSQS